MTESSTGFTRHDSDFARQIAAFCLRDHAAPSAETRAAFPSSPLWAAVAATGTGLWLDTGDIDAISALWTREFTALTTNNTLLNKEIQKGIYDDLVPEAAKLLRSGGIDGQPLVLEVAFVLNAVHGLKLVRKFDADVSVELHTDLAHDADASYHYGKRFAAIEPDRFIVKVPLTPSGLVAARRLSDDGIRVNFTLGFSARQNHVIARVARPTWVNVFMGRLNSFVADSGLGDGKNIGEKATLASQRGVRDLGGQVRQIGASIRSGEQVADLCGVDVLTIPTGAASQFQELVEDPGSIRDHSADNPEVSVDDATHAPKVAAFWELDSATRAATDALAQHASSDLSADVIVSTFRDHGSDLFPELSTDDLETLRAGGKIPVFAQWRERVENGTASWDGLLTEGALGAFSVDQGALDERTRDLLG